MNTDSMVQELFAQLQSALSTVLNAPVEMEPAAVAGSAWTVCIALPDVPELVMAFDVAGATELTRVITGLDDPADAAVESALRQICARVVTAVMPRFAGTLDDGADIRVALANTWPAGSAGVSGGLSCATMPTTVIVSVATVESTPAPAPAPAAAARQVRVLHSAGTPERLDVLLDIDLPLVVRFGCTRLPLRTLSRLGPGSLIDLSRGPDEPVEMLVGDRVVARGEVVVVSGSYGIRVVDVVSGRDGTRGNPL